MNSIADNPPKAINGRPTRDNIPAELRALKQWLPHRDKRPHRSNGRWDKWDDSANWLTFDEALAAANGSQKAGVGFLFSADGPYVGIDLDACLSADGELMPWAKRIVELLGTYCEVSMSGQGVKLIGRVSPVADVPTGEHTPPKYDLPTAKGATKQPEILVARKGRFFALTGHVYGGLNDVKDITAQLPRLRWALEGLRADGRADRTQAALAAMCRVEQDDRQDGSLRLVKAARQAKRYCYDAEEALGAFWLYEAERPFPQPIGQERIERALADADVQWGEAVDRPPDDRRAISGYRVPTWNPDFLTMAELRRKDLRVEYLIPGALVAGQPLVISGPVKTLKTSIAVDMAISLASGVKFLDHFPVPQPAPALLISGESGAATLQQTSLAVAESRGLNEAEIDALPLHWCFSLPGISVPGHLDILSEKIRKEGIKIAIVDPAYLSTLIGAPPGVSAGNVMQMGPLLMGFGQIGVETGCTMCLIHHSTKTSARNYELPALEDISYSGFGEWMRQWMLVKRRRRYESGSGRHELYLSIGGSARHGGDYALDVDEGPSSLAELLGLPPKWNALLRSVDAAKQTDNRTKVELEEERFDRLADQIRALLIREGRSRTTKYVADQLGKHGTREIKPCLLAMVDSGQVEYLPAGQNGRRWDEYRALENEDELSRENLGYCF